MIDKAGLLVAETLATFIEQEALPGTGIEAERFWTGVRDIFARFAPRNAALLETRAKLQAQIDAWHEERVGQDLDAPAYREFLRETGYVVPDPGPFSITTSNVDPEISTRAGPQLVVPILNARFVLNAANARWGSLYDALYGTDALPGEATAGGYDPARGAQVVAWAKDFLDRTVPLAEGRWSDFTGDDPKLSNPEQFVGRAGQNLLFVNNGLHIEVVIDRSHPIGRDDPGGIADVVLESALTTICDLEDSITAVDAEDKVAAYANWLGLMRGNLEETFEKGGRATTRRLKADRR